MSIKSLPGALLLLLLSQIAMAQAEKMPADSIRYFLKGAVLPPPLPDSLSMFGCRDIHSWSTTVSNAKSGKVYSPVAVKVLEVFEFEGTYSVMIDPKGKFLLMTSNLESTDLKKGDILEKGAFIGEAALSEDGIYELDLLIRGRDNKAIVDRKMVEKYFHKLR